MKRSAMALVGVALVALVASPAVVLAADETFSARLTPGAEVPPPETPGDGSGRARVVIGEDGTLEYEVTYEGLTGEPVASHIHFGAADVAGPVMIPLMHGPSPFSGTFTEADFAPVTDGPQTYAEALDAIRDGNAYVNVHTEANPPGEIRGQLRAVEPPDTATGAATSGTDTMTIIVLAIGALAFLLAFRRFAPARR